jgi:alpha-1,2-mannosyltransferase
VTRGRSLRVGVFHPALNSCGGAEWVSVEIINALKTEDYEIVVLTNEKVNREKINNLFGCKVNVDSEILFPLKLFPANDAHNIYIDILRILLLKSKCDVLIDTYSNAILPYVDMTYVHYPLSGRISSLDTKRELTASRKLKNAYYILCRFYEKRKAHDHKRLVFGNSKYTLNAIGKSIGARAKLLYPPVSKRFYVHEIPLNRENTVVSVDRISPEKRLTEIPRIARLTNKSIRFVIIGTKQSALTLEKILTLIETNNVSDRVEVMTDVPHERLQNILRTSKVFLHPTYGEHFGLSIAQAMASGCIPIVHNSGGPKEFVPKSLRFCRSEEASKKIEKAILDWTPHEAKRITNLVQPFNEENFSTRFLEIFNSYCSRLHLRIDKR